MESRSNSFPGNASNLPAPVPPKPRPIPSEKATSVPPPAAMPAPKSSGSARLLRFTCPACFAHLELDPGAPYSGQPAPCPMCHVLILPPMIFPLAANAAAAPQPTAGRFKPQRENMTIEFKRRRRET